MVLWYGSIVYCIVLYWRSYILCSIDFGAFKKDGRVPPIFILGKIAFIYFHGLAFIRS